MIQPPQALEIDELVGIARDRWRDASARVSTVPLELFVKLAMRRRVTRDALGGGSSSASALESGLAVRSFFSSHGVAGFASSSGLSSDALDWVVDTACANRGNTSASAPAVGFGVPELREDLDPASDLPDEVTLTHALKERPHAQWVEAGTTIEILVGIDGWVAARRRHRLWAFLETPEPHLVAQRGWKDWERLLDVEPDATGEPLILSPRAAAPVVAALASAFHSPESSRPAQIGAGWALADQPGHPYGLTGGSFDDAGFPTTDRVLAGNGSWLGAVGGPGSYWRGTFRQAPKESFSNLVVSPAEAQTRPLPAAPVGRCRVMRLSPDVWVLELGRKWVRVHPAELLAACSEFLGTPQVTSEGPIVPAMVLTGLC